MSTHGEAVDLVNRLFGMREVPIGLGYHLIAEDGTRIRVSGRRGALPDMKASLGDGAAPTFDQLAVAFIGDGDGLAELLLIPAAAIWDRGAAANGSIRMSMALRADSRVQRIWPPSGQESVFEVPLQDRRTVSMRPYDWAGERARALPIRKVDPEQADRETAGHADTQRQLREAVMGAGLRPTGGPRGVNCDIAWENGGVLYLGEVKGFESSREVNQLRLGLGQILDYVHRAKAMTADAVEGILAVQRKPRDDAWSKICRNLGVRLVWPDTFSTLFE